MLTLAFIAAKHKANFSAKGQIRSVMLAGQKKKKP
jgi:hypothetical protein